MKKKGERVNVKLVGRIKILMKRGYNLKHLAMTFKSDNPVERKIEEAAFESEAQKKEVNGYQRDRLSFASEDSKVLLFKRK